MSFLHKFKDNPIWFLGSILRRLGNYISDDENYLKLMFLIEMHQKLDLKNPVTFNQKLQWLKLYNRKPIYTNMVDKYLVKDYVAQKTNAEIVIPTLGVWDRFDDIDFTTLPNQFVLKTTHGGGGLTVYICKDKNKIDIEKARSILENSVSGDIYKNYREWPYKNVPHRIIAEKYMEDESGELRDYKIFCFNGEPYCVQVDFGRFDVHKRNIYDTNWNFIPFMNNTHYPYDESLVIPKPENFDYMLEVARKLSEGIPHLRVDLYNINGHVYFGETTFFHGSGFVRFYPEEWDRKLGDMIQLPQASILE